MSSSSVTLHLIPLRRCLSEFEKLTIPTGQRAPRIYLSLPTTDSLSFTQVLKDSKHPYPLNHLPKPKANINTIT